MNKPRPKPSLVSLRPGSAEDLDAIVRIMDSAFDPAFGEAWTRSQCAGILPMSGVVLTIATDECGEPVGFSLHRSVAGEAELLLIAVRRGEQRRGIGRMLLDRFASDVFETGVRHVHLEVRENNPALSVYRSAGFQLVGRRANYYSGKDRCFDALTFARDLEGLSRNSH